jgi:hypothetical protein
LLEKLDRLNILLYKQKKRGFMREEIPAFFDFLQERIYIENHLSDITWALCKASGEFMRLFLDYCFGKRTPKMRVFRREVKSNSSKPDFYCEDMKGKVWIIEVKIDVKDISHLPQYREEFKDAEIAFIANYDARGLRDYDEKLNVSITTWEKFIDYLLEKTENELIIGYSKYLKKSMKYLEVKEMNLNKVSSLPDFNSVLEKFVQEYPKKLLEFDNYQKSITISWYGRHIYFKNINEEWVYFWAGIWFRNEKDKLPYFGIVFNDVKNHKVPEKEIEIIKNLKEGEYLKKPYICDVGEVFFYLKDEYHVMLFSETPEIEKQKEIIWNSIKEVLDGL